MKRIYIAGKMTGLPYFNYSAFNAEAARLRAILFDAYTGALAVEVGDYFEWLDWYRSETCMGKRSKAVEIHGKTKRIQTLAQLCTVIIQHRREIP